MNSKSESITIIKPKSGWQLIDFKELVDYRDLFYFLVWRDIKVLYAQTILGFLWAILVPLIQIVIFTIIFGKVAKISTEGIPYILYSTVAIIPWTYMSQAMSQSSLSLVTGQSLLGKIYFPRIMFPLTPVLSKLVDFAISLVVLFGIMAYYRVVPGWNIVLLPLFALQMVMVPAAFGIFLSSLAIRFRDVKIVMQFLLRMLIYTAPIVYSAASIPQQFRIIYSLNPIVGVIEGFRACLLGNPIPWIYVIPSFAVALIVLLFATFYFYSTEKVFVDVI